MSSLARVTLLGQAARLTRFLCDDHERFRLLDDVFYSVDLMTRSEQEPLRVAAYGLVDVTVDFDDLKAGGRSALADDRKRLGLRPRIVEAVDLLIHYPKERLVLNDPRLSFAHRVSGLAPAPTSANARWSAGVQRDRPCHTTPTAFPSDRAE